LLPVLKTRISFAVLKDCGHMPSSKAELKYSDNIGVIKLKYSDFTSYA